MPKRCRRLIGETEDPDRQTELEQMATNCDRVPWEPAETFWQAVQSTWLIHMLVMAEESYPGPGTSFGRIDQYWWDLVSPRCTREPNDYRRFCEGYFGIILVSFQYRL